MATLAGSAADTLDSTALAVLDAVLADTQGTSSVVATLGTTDSTLITGTGANNEDQAALIVGAGGLSNTAFNDGLVNMSVTAGAGSVITTEGLAVAGTVAAAQEYFMGLLNAALPEESAAKTSVETAITAAMTMLQASGVTETAARLVQVASEGDVSLDLSNAGDVVQALTLGNVGGTLNVMGAASVVAIGSGTIEIGGTSGAIVAGDSGNQMIIGGAGADTMIGGSGNDTIMGGAGDTIGFNGLGNFEIGGVADGAGLQFMYAGITSLEQLAQFLTGVTETATGTTYTFVGGASITLVGMTAADLTADMISFS